MLWNTVFWISQCLWNQERTAPVDTMYKAFKIGPETFKLRYICMLGIHVFMRPRPHFEDLVIIKSFQMRKYHLFQWYFYWETIHTSVNTNLQAILNSVALDTSLESGKKGTSRNGQRINEEMRSKCNYSKWLCIYMKSSKWFLNFLIS